MGKIDGLVNAAGGNIPGATIPQRKICLIQKSVIRLKLLSSIYMGVLFRLLSSERKLLKTGEVLL